MVDKLSRTKELVVTDFAAKQQISAPQRSRLPIIPFAPLLPAMGSVASLYEHADFIESKLEQLLSREGDNSKEISMLQQVLAWLRMGVGDE